MIKEQNKRMWVFILYFYLISLAIAGRNDSLNTTPQNVALNQRRSRQTKGAPTFATRKCEKPYPVKDKNIDGNCRDSGKKYAELYFCQPDKFGTPQPSIYIGSTTETNLYIQMCPRLLCFYLTSPCPRKWEMQYIGATRVKCSDATGLAQVYHYYLEKLEGDHLYDLQSNYNDTKMIQEFSLPILRFHTCEKGKGVPNLSVAGYGLGWIYFIWQRPFENCFSNIHYDEGYYVDGYPGVYIQPSIGRYLNNKGYFRKGNFHPCPKYPKYFCFIVSEDVLPYTQVTFQVRTQRFQGEAGDEGPWRVYQFTTDDKGQGFPFCPQRNFFLTLWFLIILIVILLLLLMIAVILIAQLYKRKREIEMLEDEIPLDEEKIPPSNSFEKRWGRMKSFFTEMVPKPEVPPPPPPVPQSKSKMDAKAKAKAKAKAEAEAKAKAKAKKKGKPGKKPKPDDLSPSPPSPPPATAAQTKPKKRRGPRTEGRGRDAAARMQTKRMASGVGGVRGRRR